MKKISIDIHSVKPFVSETELQQLMQEIELHHTLLVNKKGKGNEFLGWLDLPSETSEIQLENIENIAQQLKKNSEIVVVIGIGGSYLGAKAVIEALSNPFENIHPSKPIVVYAGNHLSEDYLSSLLKLLDVKDYSLVVISKSGTTTEPAIAFRVLKQHIEKKYGKANAAARIVAITDKEKGALKQISEIEGYPTFTIPDNVGGRYSVLTPVGLLPICIAGFNIRELIQGARDMEKELKPKSHYEKNSAMQYVAARNALYRKGKPIELLVNFEPYLSFFTEWWKQLFGESEGKQHRGIFPAGVSYTTDLHSMGQYIQDGMRAIFETFISVENSTLSLKVPFDEANTDGINFLAEKSMTEINHIAETGTMLAHLEGGVPCIRISIPKMNEYYLGQLIYFFEFSCALSGYVLDVNPFDQPGVEDYKNNMFALLKKPGYEKQTEAIQAKLKK